MLEVVKMLSDESTKRHWKINGIMEDVKCMQNDYVDLKKRVEILKASSSSPGDDPGVCEAHEENTNNDLNDIQNCVDEAKSCLDTAEGFVHPCGGRGWRPAVTLDMNVPGAQCPPGWVQFLFLGNRPACYTPTGAASRCSTVIYDMTGKPYSQVCGRIHAYAIGTTTGFSAFYTAGASQTATVDDFYAGGVILSRENDHIWSFVAGTGPPNGGSTSTDCPCVDGEDNFIMANGDLPSFLNGDYFCEARLPNPSDAPLWDGLNCVDDSECCDFGTLPYFTKVLDAVNDEALEVKICVELVSFLDLLNEVGVYFMDVYVK